MGSEQQSIQTLAPAVSALVAGMAFIVSLLSLYLNFRFQRRSKQTDIQIGFHVRFDNLQVERANLLARTGTLPAPEGDHQAKIFFHRFWSLQFDQYLAWQRQYVADDIYRLWVFSRWHQFNGPTSDWSINGRTVGSTFDEIDKEWPRDPLSAARRRALVAGFLNLHQELRRAKDESTVDRLIMSQSPRLLKRALAVLDEAA